MPGCWQWLASFVVRDQGALVVACPWLVRSVLLGVAWFSYCFVDSCMVVLRVADSYIGFMLFC